ncbi:hypothetical protein KIH77_05590 [Bifidobacterium sp. 82T24]|uniref:hypothetical protein n=1 Tax=Bifidobacterium pluvialisilvae TaxID=2834436 RepID=UPI001C55BE79|nr:hypothetical protein [Bifidobacterium pluvialisilvae]MBW3088203.1 hypothetical protein [Bifidobacterium pluvialisilvae]
MAMLVLALLIFEFKGVRMSELPDHSSIHHGSPIRIDSPAIMAVGIVASFAVMFWLVCRERVKKAPVAVVSLWHGVTLVADPSRPHTRIDVIVFGAYADRIVAVPARYDDRWCAAMLHVHGEWIRLEGFRALASDTPCDDMPAAGRYDPRSRTLLL